MKVIKRAEERSNALKVIKENELKQVRRQEDYLKQKYKDAESIKLIMKEQELKEKKRLEEIGEREQRIKKIMDGMGDQIFTRDREL